MRKQIYITVLLKFSNIFFTCMEYSLFVCGLNLCYFTAWGPDHQNKINCFNLRCFTKLFIVSSSLLSQLYVTCKINSCCNDILLPCKWFLNLKQISLLQLFINCLAFIFIISLLELCFSCQLHNKRERKNLYILLVCMIILFSISTPVFCFTVIQHCPFPHAVQTQLIMADRLWQQNSN